ncbi:MAG: DUF4176 domain-containing protein [Acidobacteriota bacterium]|nr:DUF4176 domain-containing protein [Acidobacteriota bacterium]
MESTGFLPLGTVVVLKGNPRKFMIIARGVVVKQPDGSFYYDYGSCLWPEGLLGDRVAYFNRDAIHKVVSRGYADGDDELMQENLAESLKKVHVPKGDPKPLTADQAGGERS